MFANNTIFSPSFYNGQRLVSTVDRDLQNNIITGYEYTYDNSDRILQEMNLADNTKICYTYDNLSRVINRTVYDSLDEVLSSEDFEYDVYGNIITANADEHIYDINNRLVSVNNTAITYDLDGNMTSDGVMNYTYDSQNRLTSAGVNSYIYNAENVRIKKINGNNYIEYTYDTVSSLSRLLYTQDQNGNITKFIHGVGLIGQIATNELSVYHYDYRGSTVAITNENGITDTFKYDTYGKLISRTGTTDIPFRYNGRDGVMTDENGLLYMRARYYNPNLQRFVNADILIGEVTDFVTLNRYSYANGNPVSNVDPFGLSVDDRGKESKNQDISDITRDIARLLIGNSINNWFTKNGYFEDLFRIAGFVRTEDLQGTYVYHATMDCLQRFGGYNSFYDLVFDYSTSMKNAKFDFTSGGEDYILWAWKGDYLNLGAGAEMGIYKQLDIMGYDMPHWLVDRDLSMYMTLNLDYKDKTIISWDPKKDTNYNWEELWWVTGFNPYVTNVNAKDLTATYSVAFNDQTMYNDFYNKYGNPKSKMQDARWSFDSNNNTATFRF